MPISEIRLNEMKYLTPCHLACNQQNLYSSQGLSNQSTVLSGPVPGVGKQKQMRQRPQFQGDGFRPGTNYEYKE